MDFVDPMWELLYRTMDDLPKLCSTISVLRFLCSGFLILPLFS